MKPFAVTLQITDAGGDTSPLRVYFERRVDDGLPDLEQRIHDFWDALLPLTNGHLSSVSIAIEPDISAWDNQTAAAIADIEEQARFLFRTTGNHLGSFSIPCLLETKLINGGASPYIDTTDSDVILFVHVCTTDEDEDGVALADSHNEPIIRLEAAKQKWGK